MDAVERLGRTENPSFSIVVPTYNRPGPLSQCLESIALIDYPADRFEVIVVDDGSHPSPCEIVARYGKRFPIRLLSKENGGPASARNFGARVARGDYLFFTDDDCRVERDLLRRLAVHLERAPDAAIGGSVVNALLRNIYSNVSQTHVRFLYDYYNRDFDRAQFFSSNNIAFPATLFHQIQGFDTSLATGEDREICDRWLASGHSLLYRPDVAIKHAHELTFASFWSQHFHYGKGAFQTRRLRARRERHRIYLESWRFYLQWIAGKTDDFSRPWTWLARTLLVVSLVANGAGFLSEALRARALTAADLRR